MKIVLLLIGFILLAAAAGLVIREDPGSVYLAYGEWSVETSLAVFLVVLVVLFTALYFAVRLLAQAWRVPGKVRAAARERAVQRARRGLTQGLIELAEGRWERAEKLLLRDVARSEHPLLHFLAAARAAQQQGAHQRRDAYLKRAIESNPEADVAVTLTQAELQLAHHQTERALASLSRLRNLAPRHDYVLRLLSKIYHEVGDWKHLSQLLPEVRKRGLFPAEEFALMERATWSGLLDTPETDDRAELARRWEALPKAAREVEPILLHYVARLRAAGGGAEAEPALRAQLSRRWSGKLVHAYGLVEAPDAARQLDTAEGWLKHHGRDPLLLLSLGRLCKRRELWGKARMYLESSLGVSAKAETHRELAELLEQLGERDAALEHYRSGLAISLQEDAPGQRAATGASVAALPARVAPGAPQALPDPAAEPKASASG